MTKELTPLEALNEIKKQVGNIHLFDFSGYLPREITSIELRNSELFTTVEKALKQLEMEHTLRIRLENANYELVRKQEKQDEILRIIKEKKVNINFLNNCISYGNYLLGSYPRDISKEEFDLLKEVFK